MYDVIFFPLHRSNSSLWTWSTVWQPESVQCLSVQYIVGKCVWAAFSNTCHFVVNAMLIIHF